MMELGSVFGVVMAFTMIFATVFMNKRFSVFTNVPAIIIVLAASMPSICWAEQPPAQDTTVPPPLPAEQALELRSIRQLIGQAADAKDPNQVDHLIQQAKDRLIKMLIADAPDHIEPWRYLAQLAVTQKDHVLAAVSLNAIQQLKPDYQQDPAYLDLAAQLNNISGAKRVMGVLNAKRPLAYQLCLVEALSTASELQDDLLREQAYHTIIQTQIKAGDTAGALLIASEVTTGRFLAASYREIAQAQTEAGDLATARQTLTQALFTAAGQITDPSNQARAYLEIAQAQAQAEAGDVAGALSTTAMITETDDKSVAYALIGAALSTTNDAPTADSSPGT